MTVSDWLILVFVASFVWTCIGFYLGLKAVIGALRYAASERGLEDELGKLLERLQD